MSPEQYSPNPEELSLSEKDKKMAGSIEPTTETLQSVREEERKKFAEGYRGERRARGEHTSEEQAVSAAVEKFFDRVDRSAYTRALEAAMVSGQEEEFFARTSEIVQPHEHNKDTGEKITKEILRDTLGESIYNIRSMTNPVDLTLDEREQLRDIQQTLSDQEKYNDSTSGDLREFYENLKELTLLVSERKNTSRDTEEKTNVYGRMVLENKQPTTEELELAQSETKAFLDDVTKEDKN